jgi:nucleotidyltransferase substrate binding protein (TIGR01987 family)
MEKADLRWQQRYNNFLKAFSLLEAAVKQSHMSGLNELEEQGLIQRFEFTHELAWNVLKDYFDYQGIHNIIGSRDATREAFKNGMIGDGDGWMEMIRSRNESSHTYNEDVADELKLKIINVYYPLFSEFRMKMDSLQHR